MYLTEVNHNILMKNVYIFVRQILVAYKIANTQKVT